MNLFSNMAEPEINLLPEGGVVNYYGTIMNHHEAENYLHILLNTIEWKNDEAFILGKHIITKRKVAWYGNDNYSYTYSNTTKQALSWTNELLQLKTLAEKLSCAKFNSCLLNLYHNGDEGMAWHSDDEKALAKHSNCLPFIRAWQFADNERGHANQLAAPAATH
jgi:alkylated DNA repair dioxygenase AlkB